MRRKEKNKTENKPSQLRMKQREKERTERLELNTKRLFSGKLCIIKIRLGIFTSQFLFFRAFIGEKK